MRLTGITCRHHCHPSPSITNGREPSDVSMNTAPQPRYTHNILLQMIFIMAVVAGVSVWQAEVITQIYLTHQINAIGWGVNGGIALLFGCGLLQLIKRFFEYGSQERAIHRFQHNIQNSDEPLLSIAEKSMIAKRFLVLKSLNRQRANINQGALAATLHAAESSRNSFLKFVHNVLILTGVFGTIISLSVALLGASDLLQSGGLGGLAARGDGADGQIDGLSRMIFGMATALSTTLTAIFAYLFFGYFYIKLTDTQTFLLSKIEEVTATTLMPHLQLNQDASVLRDYAESIRLASNLVQKLDQSQQKYADAATTLESATRRLAAQVGQSPATGDDNKVLARIMESLQQQQAATQHNTDNLSEAVSLLRRGFRLKSEK